MRRLIARKRVLIPAVIVAVASASVAVGVVQARLPWAAARP
jgi:hypothetical protein